MEDLNEQQLVTSAQLQPRERQLSNTLRRLQTTGPAHDLHTEKPMQATIEMPEPVYQKSAKVARKLGFTVEELIVQVLDREMASEASAAPRGGESKFSSNPFQESWHTQSLEFRFR